MEWIGLGWIDYGCVWNPSCCEATITGKERKRKKVYGKERKGKEMYGREGRGGETWRLAFRFVSCGVAGYSVLAAAADNDTCTLDGHAYTEILTYRAMP